LNKKIELAAGILVVAIVVFVQSAYALPKSLEQLQAEGDIVNKQGNTYYPKNWLLYVGINLTWTEKRNGCRADILTL
jgi:hypothetical protein